jgi:DNA-binding NarL/FixJ family response regulator
MFPLCFVRRGGEAVWETSVKRVSREFGSLTAVHKYLNSRKRTDVDIATKPLRVRIIEKQLLFGKAVAHALSADPHVKIIGITASLEATFLTEEEADVVVIDIDNVDDIDDMVESFKIRFPSTRICALSMHTQPDLLQHCLSIGADAYIVKDSSLQELLTAIKTLGEGFSYVDPRVAADLLRRSAPSHRSSMSNLSPRERDIIRLIAQGLSNRDIGRRLILSEKTVKNHVSHIFSKLHFTTRSQAAVHAVRNGLA